MVAGTGILPIEKPSEDDEDDEIDEDEDNSRKMSELYLALGNNSVPFNLWVEVMIRLLKILDVTIYQVIDMPVKKLKNVLYVEPGHYIPVYRHSSLAWRRTQKLQEPNG